MSLRKYHELIYLQNELGWEIPGPEAVRDIEPYRLVHTPQLRLVLNILLCLCLSQLRSNPFRKTSHTVLRH